MQKNNQDIPLLLTSTIFPNASYTTITDNSLRLEQYRAAIYFWLAYTKVKKIVFCDNSNVSPLSEDELINLQSVFDKKIEILNFFSDEKKVKEKGKGFGEGEIIKYALENSIHLKLSDSFYKCTGRIVVSNFDEITSNFHNESVFYLRSANLIDQIDTRFFLVKKEIYLKYIVDAHEYVNDDNYIYLEHCVFNSIKGNTKNRYFTRYPKYLGVSGSTGDTYKLSNLKYNLNCFLSMIGYLCRNVI